MRKVGRIGQTWKLKLQKRIRVTDSSKTSTLNLRVVAVAVLNAQVVLLHQHLRIVAQAHPRNKNGKKNS